MIVNVIRILSFVESNLEKASLSPRFDVLSRSRRTKRAIKLELGRAERILLFVILRVPFRGFFEMHITLQIFHLLWIAFFEFCGQIISPIDIACPLELIVLQDLLDLAEIIFLSVLCFVSLIKRGCGTLFEKIFVRPLLLLFSGAIPKDFTAVFVGHKVIVLVIQFIVQRRCEHVLLGVLTDGIVLVTVPECIQMARRHGVVVLH